MTRIGNHEKYLRERINRALAPRGLKVRSLLSSVQRNMHDTAHATRARIEPWAVMEIDPYGTAAGYGKIVARFAALAAVVETYHLDVSPGVARVASAKPQHVLRLFEQPRTCREVAEMLGVDWQAVRYQINRMRDAGQIVCIRERMSGDVELQPNRYGVHNVDRSVYVAAQSAGKVAA